MATPNRLPPSNVSPAELWAKMTETPRPVKIVDFPRAVGDQRVEVAIRCLTQDEQMRVHLNGQMAAKRECESHKLPFNAVDAKTTIEYHNTVEVLFAVCRNPSNPEEPFFRSRDEIRKHLSADECAALTNEWRLFTAETSPLITDMSGSEIDAWIEYIALEGASLPLARMTPAALIHLLNSMASQLYSLRPGKESPGSQPSDTSDA